MILFLPKPVLHFKMKPFAAAKGDCLWATGWFHIDIRCLQKPNLSQNQKTIGGFFARTRKMPLIRAWCLLQGCFLQKMNNPERLFWVHPRCWSRNRWMRPVEVCLGFILKVRDRQRGLPVASTHSCDRQPKSIALLPAANHIQRPISPPKPGGHAKIKNPQEMYARARVAYAIIEDKN